MVEKDERLNKVKIAKTKKIRKDVNDVAQKVLYIYVCVCVLMRFIYIIMEALQ